MVRHVRRRLVVGLIGALTSLAGVSFAVASPSPDDSVSRAAEDGPSPAIEDSTYPGAERVLADKGIVLKKGDGGILLAECDRTADQIKVMTVADAEAGRDGTYCFQATGKVGYLTLELPRVFALETSEHPISADLTANGETSTVDLPKNGFKSVGEGTTGGAESVLVEIRVTG